MDVRRVVMMVVAVAPAEELRAATIVNLMQQLVLYEEHQGAEECRAIDGHHAMLHIGKREGAVVLYDLLHHHEAYSGGAYAQLL